MKQLLTIAIFIFLLFPIANAQHFSNVFRAKTFDPELPTFHVKQVNKHLSSRDYMEKLDSLTGYDYDYNLQYSYRFYYDENGLSPSFIASINEGNEWLNSYSGEFLYDENNNLIYEEFFTWENNQWENDSRVTHTFDNDGINLLVTSRKHFSIDQWNNDWKHEFVYGKGNLDEELLYHWHDDQWNLSHKFVFTYNDDGLVILQERFNWDENLWKTSSKWDYTYYTTNLLKEMIRYSYNNSTGEHNLYFIEEFYYDNDGNQTESVTSEYSNEQWNYSWKYDYTYDASITQNNIYLPSIFVPYADFVFINQYLTNYYENGKLLIANTLYWDDDISEWILTYNHNFHYSEFNPVSIEDKEDYAELTTYPNPTSSTLNVTLNNEETITEIEVISAYGIKEEVKFTQGLNSLEIDVQGLPVGFYVLRINNDHTARFIKQ